MKTLKEFLTENGLHLTEEQRYKLGARIGQSWATKNYGKDRQYTDEDDFTVRVYDDDFFNHKKVRRCVLKFLKTL
jgi:hypothetical protein